MYWFLKGLAQTLPERGGNGEGGGGGAGLLSCKKLEKARRFAQGVNY